jgi:hypothetical protein
MKSRTPGAMERTEPAPNVIICRCCKVVSRIRPRCLLRQKSPLKRHQQKAAAFGNLSVLSSTSIGYMSYICALRTFFAGPAEPYPALAHFRLSYFLESSMPAMVIRRYPISTLSSIASALHAFAGSRRSTSRPSRHGSRLSFSSRCV